jgi:hypothetical protein
MHSRQVTADGIHTAISYIYADALARVTASGFVTEDLYKMAWQLSGQELWMLSSISPVTWTPIVTVSTALPGPIFFSYNTASPLTLTGLLPNDVIDTVEITVTTPFNDPAATLSVGTVLTPNLCLTIPANVIGSFEAEENFKMVGAETLRLSIVPGTSTQGAGYCTFTLRS